MIHAVIVAELSEYDQTGSRPAPDNEADEDGVANRYLRWQGTARPAACPTSDWAHQKQLDFNTNQPLPTRYFGSQSRFI
jgi:hypothetical protein